MRLLLLTLALVLMGQECGSVPPEPGPNANPFCAQNDYTVAGSVRNVAAELSGASSLGKAFSAILQGKPSTNRRSTVRVQFGQSYCSGTALGPRVVLSAGHCGYAPTTAHDVLLGDYDSTVYQAERHIVHPDYLKYVANPADREARKADLMVLIMAEDVPGPYPAGIYDATNPAQYRFCRGALAQGWGRHEPLCVGGADDREICETDADCSENGTCAGGVLDLRETKYIVTKSSDPKYLTSRAADVPPGEESGVICYGDSGSSLQVDVNGSIFIAGVTSTTMSTDCLAGGNHVNIAYPPFRQWLYEAAVDGNGNALPMFGG